MELKLRAWRNDEMLYQQQEGYAYVAALLNRIYQQHEVMMFTGMHDIKGKDIYLSDIINVANCECVGYDDQGHEMFISCVGEVLFEDGMFVFDGHSAGTIPLNAFIAEMEIIGNIHENPELLN